MSKRILHTLLLLACSASAAALEVVPSGFGTVGYAQSNRPYAFERFIDEGGTLDRDSVFGLQLDARLGMQWSATLQLKAAPSLKSDSRWDVRPAWAFVGWRPSDDWLLRAGRMRAPLYMYSESMDVGVTHDMVRLPTEMYSIAPSTDFDGASVGKTWARGDNEYALDAYAGRFNTSARLWFRDGAPPVVPAGAQFFDVEVRSAGLVFSLRQPGTLWRAGWHHTTTRQISGATIPVDYAFVPVAPGLGYYQVDPSLPGPGVNAVASIRNDIFTFGLEHQFGQGWRVAAEYARNVQHDTQLGSDTRGGYVAVFKELGRATPYVSVGALRSSTRQLDWFDNLTMHPLPDVIPGAAQINAAQRLAAESFYATDQRSLALGSSFSIDPQQKVKVEWKRTHIGRVSRLVDTPAGSDEVHDTHIDVWSVNYNFAF